MPPALDLPNPVSSQLTTRAVTTSEGLLALRQVWTRLFDDSHSTNPFARWEWTFHWWQTFGRPTTSRVRDQLLILVHEDQAGGIHGITPLVKTTLGGDWLGMTKLRNAGSVPGTNLTEMAPYLWSPGRELQVAQALAQALDQYRHTCDWIELHGIPFDTPFGRAFARTPVAEHADWHAPTPYFLLPLPQDWESLRSRLTKNGREYLRQVAKRLERLG